LARRYRGQNKGVERSAARRHGLFLSQRRLQPVVSVRALQGEDHDFLAVDLQRHRTRRVCQPPSKPSEASSMSYCAPSTGQNNTRLVAGATHSKSRSDLHGGVDVDPGRPQTRMGQIRRAGSDTSRTTGLIRRTRGLLPVVAVRRHAEGQHDNLGWPALRVAADDKASGNTAASVWPGHSCSHAASR